MAGKKDLVKQPALSEEYITDSSDEDEVESLNQTSRIREFRSDKSAENDLKLSQSSNIEEVADEEQSSFAEESSDEAEEQEDEAEGSDVDKVAEGAEEEVDENGEGSEEEALQDDFGSATLPGRSDSGKRRTDSPGVAEQRPAKKTKATPQPPIAIAAKPFTPPKGFEKVTTDRASPAFLSERGKRQVWYFTAPASISIQSLGSLDMDAVSRGQPVINQGGASYQLAPAERTNETLLLAEGDDGKYVARPVTITKIFHLRHAMTPKAADKPLLPSNPAKLNFTATAPGGKKPVRPQPEDLRMRYQPYGSRQPSSQNSINPPKKPTESSKISEVTDNTVLGTPRRTKKMKTKSKHSTADLRGEEAVAASPRTPAPAVSTEPNSAAVLVPSPAVSQSSDLKEKKKKRKKSRLVDEAVV